MLYLASQDERDDGLRAIPVELDWQIVDEEVDPSEGPVEAPTSRSGCRRWGGFALIVGLILAVGLGFIWQQLRHKRQEIEREVCGVVELELQALVRGDRELFLTLQDSSGAWRKAQIGLFQDYQSWTQGQALAGEQRVWTSEPVGYTGEIGRVQVAGKEAQVEVEIECQGGQETCWQIWLYRWDDDTWYHASIDEAWLGEEREMSTAHFDFIYPERDGPAVEELAGEMEAWYDRLAPLYGLDSGSGAEYTRMTVEFTYRSPRSAASEFHWLAHKTRWLQAASLHQMLWSQDGTPSSKVRRTLARFLIEALVADASGVGVYGRNLPPEMWALFRELRDWALKPLNVPPDPIQPDTPLVDALVAQHGETAIRLLVAGLNQWETLEEALSATGLELSDPTRVFAFLLQAEHQLELDEDFRHFQEFVDPQVDQTWLASKQAEFEPSASDGSWSAWRSSSAQITSVVFQGDLAWVEAKRVFLVIRRAEGQADERYEVEPADYYRTFFFRRLGERWLHTSPDPAYFGAERVEQSANLTLRYFERDATLYVGGVERLQSILEQAAADLGVDITGKVFTLEITIQPGRYGWLDPSFTHLLFTSPHLSGWSDHPVYDAWSDLAISLIRTLAVFKLTQLPGWPDATGWALIQAVTVWEQQRLFPTQVDQAWLWWFATRVNVAQVAAQSLADFVPVSPSAQTLSDVIRVWSSYELLVEYLAETYGPEVIPALLTNFDVIDDVDEWLRLSTGEGVGEIEPAWQEWVLATYGDK